VSARPCDLPQDLGGWDLSSHDPSPEVVGRLDWNVIAWTEPALSCTFSGADAA